MSSESDNNLPAQPPPTCPLIDNAISDVQAMEDADSRQHREALASSASGYMEDARKNAEEIRDWGQAWKEHANQLQYQLDEEQSKLSALRDKLDDILSDIDSLHNDVSTIGKEIE